MQSETQVYRGHDLLVNPKNGRRAIVCYQTAYPVDIIVLVVPMLSLNEH